MKMLNTIAFWCRSGEEDPGAAAGGEEDRGVPRGRARRRRLVPAARRPPSQGKAFASSTQMLS